MMPNTDKSTLPTVFVIFGATGDLTARKLVPALWHLYQKDLLPPLTQIIGFSRQNLTSQEWRAQVQSMVKVRGPKAKKAVSNFAHLFFYQPGTFENPTGYAALGRALGQQDKQWRTCANKLFYLAVPPQYFKTILQNLSDSGLTIPCSEQEGWTRVIVEKPFGKDLSSAQELDGLLGTLFKEEQIYRIDHYLGKETVRNILAFRFSNSIFEPAWDARSIATIHLNFSEKMGIGRRGEFYDSVGALRDVGQNHLLQLLALFTMDNPADFSAAAIRQGRLHMLQALEVRDAQRGQYRGYKREPGVKKNSTTETYFRLEVQLNTSRWRGMPVILESGKKLKSSLFEVTVTFRHQTPCLCPPGQHYTNVLRYRIQPKEGITTSFWVKKPGLTMAIEEKDFTFDYQQAFGKNQFIDAYTKLLLDVINGDQTLFVSTAEILASWRLIDPIIATWQKNRPPLQPYQRGLAPSLRPSANAPAKLIGYIGLGKMGANMVARLQDHGWQVVATDPSAPARTRAAHAGASIVENSIDVVKQLPTPRLIWLMVPHQTVDPVVAEITSHLEKGDVVIDGGNSHYQEAIRRSQALAKQGVSYMDVGVSGGPSGARAGACLMIGGQREIYKKYMSLFSDLATAGGYDYMGPAGAGHFVKMVHNGIEYGMMQAIAEGFSVLKKHPAQFDLERIANLYNHDSVIESRLVAWLKDAYAKYGPELAEISGSVAHSGEGLWTVEAARQLGIPVPIIAAALQFRVNSADQPSYTGQILSALRNQFGGHDVKKK